MPLRISIDLGHRPEFGPDELLAIVERGFGESYDVHRSGRFQVWDVMVEESPEVGAAIQIVQRRLRKRTLLRVYGLAPSIALRGATPVGLQQQEQRTRPLVEEVAGYLKRNVDVRRR